MPLGMVFFKERKYTMLLHQIVERYNLEVTDLVQIHEGFQNTVYSFQREGRNYILRITAKCRRRLEEIENEFAFIFALDEQGVRVSLPIRSIHGRLVERFPDQDKHVFVTVFEKASGKPVDVTDKHIWNEAFFYHWGMVIGAMHDASKGINKKLTRPVWNCEDPDLLGLLPQMNSERIKQQYIHLLNKLKSFSPTPENFGLIHNDLHQGNFLVDNGKMTVFDFDDCAYHWFANDLAVSFYHAYWQTTSFTPEFTNFSNVFWEHFLKGYKQKNELTKEMILQIPIFLKIREIFLYHLFLEKWDLDHLEDWQMYTLSDLKSKIENGIPYSNIDFTLLSEELFDKGKGSLIQ